jgi:voltage-gated potassium channel Kch
MSADLGLARTEPALLAGATAVLLLAKTLIGYVLARGARQNNVNALRFALALPQSSEFSFVLFAAAVTAGALGAAEARMATLVVAASMLATPIVFAGAEALLIPRLLPRVEPAYDTIVADGSPAIIAGFGRMGQIVGRVLTMHGIRFTALERDPGQVEVVRRYGNNVFFGDPTRAEVLRAAGAEEAKLLVVTLGEMDAVLRTVETARRHFPNLKILARARNRRHAHLLIDRGVDGLVRETFLSSLSLAEQSLTALGIEPDAASRAIGLFREHDEKTLAASQPFYRDEKKLIQTTQDAAAELAGLFEADREQ